MTDSKRELVDGINNIRYPIMDSTERIADFILAREQVMLEEIEKPVEDIADALDKELGDTDPEFPEDITDEEIKDESPVFWACQKANEAIAIINKLRGNPDLKGER